MRAEINGDALAKTNAVFVFGSEENENRGFRFKMSNFFRGVINMFKFK